MRTAMMGTLRASFVVRSDASAAACAAYVAAHPRASAYHHPEWTALIGRAFGHETQYLTAEVDGIVAGVCPLVFFRSRLFGRFAVSLPFVNYGGIIADSPDIERSLLDAAVASTERAGGTHLELRHNGRLFPSQPARRHKVAMLLPLAATVEEQWAALDRKVRNQVRKAEKSGLDVAIGGLERLDDFYAVFARNMRDLGTPVYSRRFFAEVLSVFPDASRVFVVTLKGQPLAASIVHGTAADAAGGARRRSALEVPWASAVRDYNALCPNVLLYWHMLRYAVDRGFSTFDFGRSTPNEGTFHFKRQWGAAPRELVWEYWLAGGRSLPNLNPQNPKFAAAIRAWQRLPVGVATALGPHIVRHIP